MSASQGATLTNLIKYYRNQSVPANKVLAKSGRRQESRRHVQQGILCKRTFNGHFVASLTIRELICKTNIVKFRLHFTFSTLIFLISSSLVSFLFSF